MGQPNHRQDRDHEADRSDRPLTGFERVYQGSIILKVWDMELQPKGTIEKEMTVKFIEL